MKYREGILLGSACEAGELYQYVVAWKYAGRSGTESYSSMIIWKFSHWETMRLCCAVIREPIESEEDLKDINRQIVELGEQFNKLVVATCDVHFLDPEDSRYIAVSLWQDKGFDDSRSAGTAFSCAQQRKC